MYTSMRFLRENDACIPGYTRMASFMGMQPTVKDIKIPIWMLGLFGESDDTFWAINGAMVVDRKEFEQFKTLTFVETFKNVYWTARENCEVPVQQPAVKSTNLVRKAMLEGEKLSTAEEIQAYLTKYSGYQASHVFWSDVIQNECWHNPIMYLLAVHNSVNRLYPDVYHEWLEQQEKKAKVLSKGKDVKDKDAEKDDEENSNWTHSTRLRIKESNLRFFSDSSKSTQEIFASLFFDKGTDVYAEALRALNNNGYIKTKNKVVLTQLNGTEDTPPVFQATVTLTDPKVIFRLYHLCQAADFDVRQVFGLDSLIADISEKVDRRNKEEASMNQFETKTKDEQENILNAATAEALRNTSYSSGRATLTSVDINDDEESESVEERIESDVHSW